MGKRRVPVGPKNCPLGRKIMEKRERKQLTNRPTDAEEMIEWGKMWALLRLHFKDI